MVSVRQRTQLAWHGKSRGYPKDSEATFGEATPLGVVRGRTIGTRQTDEVRENDVESASDGIAMQCAEPKGRAERRSEGTDDWEKVGELP